MQQATANLFADMGAQGATLQTDLTRPSCSSDAAPPTVANHLGGSDEELGHRDRHWRRPGRRRRGVHGRRAHLAPGGRTRELELHVAPPPPARSAAGPSTTAATSRAAGPARAVRPRAAVGGGGSTAAAAAAAARGGGGSSGSGSGKRSGPRALRHVAPRPRVPRRPAEAADQVRGRQHACKVALRLRRNGRTLASPARGHRAPARPRTVRLYLSRSVRRKLALEGALRVTAVASVPDRAGRRTVTRTAIRLLASRGR